MTEITKETRRELATRIARMENVFTAEYIKELAKAEEEKKAAAAMKNESGNEFKCLVMTGDWNAQVDLECMKSCVEIIAYLTEDDCDMQDWQHAAITAMLDTANENHFVDYSMPQAISDVLGIRFIKKEN